MNKDLKTGHLLAAMTVIVWGTTFISTKVLLRTFEPIAILFIRFLLGYGALWLAAPRPLKTRGFREELPMIAAGLCGVTLYFLLENIALEYTYASNVSVILSVAPFFTAILSFFFLKGERPGGFFFAGFAVSLLGIVCIGFAGSALALNPLGDVLALLAAVVWAAYTILTRRIAGFGYSRVQTTRRIFFWGLVFMLPVVPRMVHSFPSPGGLSLTALLNLLYLGFIASALCFVTWGRAVQSIGAAKTSAYIYLVPVVTVAASSLLLKEQVTPLSFLGVLLTLLGLILSQRKSKI